MNQLFQNSIPRGKVYKWFPSDTAKLFQQNLKKHRDRINELGWHKDSIVYYLDKFGFRNDEAIDLSKEYNLILGCSHTFGVGVPSQYSWYNVLKDKFDEPFYNAAVPGGSIGACTRSLMGLLEMGMKIKRVFVLLPDRTRFEAYDGNNWMVISWWTEHSKEFINTCTHENTLNLFHEVNKLAIQKICNDLQIEIVDLPVDDKDELDALICDDKKARDLMHPGVDAHKWIGERFYDEYCQRYGSST